MRNIFQDIWNFFLSKVQPLIRWSQTHTLPGCHKLPLYDIIIFFRNELRKNKLVTRANSMSYSFFLALFPSLIVLFTLIPYFRINNAFLPQLQVAIENVLPGDAGDSLFHFIRDLATRKRSGLLSFSFFLALYFASNGMLAMMSGFDKEYWITFKKRGFWRRRIVAVFLTMMLAGILIGSIILVILGNIILNSIGHFLHIDGFTTVLIKLLRWLIIIVLYYTGISFIYRYAVSMRRRVDFINTGTTVATIFCLLSSWVFSKYIENFGMYNKLYGSLGTVIIILLWIQMNCFVLLTGFELNTSIYVQRDLKESRQLSGMLTSNNEYDEE